MNEDLRRTPRVTVCCLAIVHDRYAVWTGVTADVSAGGCRIVSPRLLRAGSRVIVTLSSDLFSEDLEMVGEAVWATSDHLAIRFSRPVRQAAFTPAEWVGKVRELGAATGPRSPIVPTVSVRPRGANPLAPAGDPCAAPAVRAAPDDRERRTRRHA